MEANYWLILGLVLLIGEVFTLDFSLSCFGISCFVAALFSALGLNIYWQLAAASLTILALLFTLRPFALKYLIKAKDFKDNIAALIGTTATVTEADGVKGMVKIDADHWAISADKPLAAGDIVKINKVDGITLLVTKEEK